MEDNKDVKTENVEETTQKTYTKEELDASFNAGVKKASSDWQKDEKYKEFLAWKKTNQNDGERLAELETSNASLLNENKLLKAQIEVNSSDVKKEFSEFVTSEVLKKVNDTTSFEEALKDYKKEKPQYFGETVVTKVKSSPALSGEGKSQTTNDIMNGLLRGTKN